MCGVIYGRSKNECNPVNKFILKQFMNQRNRGTQGFGIYDPDFQHIIKETKESKIKKWLKKHPSKEILFHHRFPTSTKNVKNAAHPFSTKDYFGDVEYILIHNGVISNSYELARQHTERGIEYSSVQPNGTFNDSEALLFDIALTLEGEQSEPKAIGSCAFIMIEKHKDDPKLNKLHYYHNSVNPLFKRDTAKMWMLSSTQEGNAQHVPVNVLYSYNYETEQTDHRLFYVETGRWNSAHYQSSSYEADRFIQTIQDEEEEEMEAQKKLVRDSEAFAASIKKTVKDFMTDASGYYEIAIGLMQEELDEVSAKPYALALWYRIQVLSGAIAALLTDPFWKPGDSEAKHPMWEHDEGKNWQGESPKQLALPVEVSSSVEPLTAWDHEAARHHQMTVVGEVLDKTAIKKVTQDYFKKHTVGTAPELISKIPVLA